MNSAETAEGRFRLYTVDQWTGTEDKSRFVHFALGESCLSELVDPVSAR